MAGIECFVNTHIVITAKNETERDFNDPSETLPIQNPPSVPLVALSSPSSPGGRRESIFPSTAPEAQLAAIHAAHSAEGPEREDGISQYQ